MIKFMFKKFFLGALVFALALGGFMPLNSRAEEQFKITLGTPNFTSSTTAEIYWTTNNVAKNCSVDYMIGVHPSDGKRTNGQIIQSLTFNDDKYHYYASLSDLTADVDYYYRVNCLPVGADSSDSTMLTKLTAQNPDLTIKDIYISDDKIVIKYCNDGWDFSSISNTFRIIVAANGKTHSDQYYVPGKGLCLNTRTRDTITGGPDPRVGYPLSVFSISGEQTISVTAEIDKIDEVAELNENNNIYTKTITIGSVANDSTGKPDLVITDAYFFPETPKAQQAFTGSLRIKVKNQGTAAATSAEGIVVRQSVANGAGTERTLVSWLESNKSYSLNSLAAGASDEIIIPINSFAFPYDRLVLRAWVDSNGVAGSWDASANDFQMKNDDLYIDESNEDNNTYRKTITIGSTTEINKTDKNSELFIKDIVADDGEIKVIIGNLGPDAVSDEFTVALTETTNKAFFGDVSVLYGGYAKGVKTINSGEVGSVSFYEINPGTYSLLAKVDADNNIAEKDENNNTYTKTITVNDISNNTYVANEGEITFYNNLNQLGKLPTGYNEWLIVNAVTNDSQHPVESSFKYKGIIEIMMDGIIQANGKSLSDAYYILTDNNGNPINPVPAKEYGLQINNRKVADIWPQKYIKGSQYVFRANLGSSYRTVEFFIGDSSKSDNSGSFKVAIKGEAIEQSNQPQDVSPGQKDTVGDQTGKSVDSLILKLERTISELSQKVIDMEKRLVEKVDKALSERVKGRILLQTEANGEAWYVDPNSENKFYMQDGLAAYDIMRALGLGITNKDLETIPIGIQDKIYTLADTDGDKIPDNLEIAIGTDPSKADTDGDGFDDKSEILSGYKPTSKEKFSYNQNLINRLKGRIALQVESHGEAWYINPTDGKRYYLGDGNTAYNVMRFLSLGITNDNLRKIQVGEFSE